MGGIVEPGAPRGPCTPMPPPAFTTVGRSTTFTGVERRSCTTRGRASLIFATVSLRSVTRWLWPPRIVTRVPPVPTVTSVTTRDSLHLAEHQMVLRVALQGARKRDRHGAVLVQLRAVEARDARTNGVARAERQRGAIGLGDLHCVVAARKQTFPCTAGIADCVSLFTSTIDQASRRFSFVGLASHRSAVSTFARIV